MAKEPKQTEDTTELVVVKEQTALEAFNDDAALEKMFKDIKAAFEKQFPDGLDMNNKKDRAALRSAAAKIPKVKTRIEEFRKQATEDMRLKVAAMTKRGNDIWDWLDELHKEKRKPLTDWENAEAERQNQIKTTIEAIRTAGQISFGESSEQIQARIDGLPTHDIDFYAEFQDEAQIVIDETFNKLVAAKQIAVNAEKDAEDRAAEKAELDRLRAATEKSEREAAARAEITTIKQAGAGVLYINDDFLPTPKILDWLYKLRIDSRFGDLIDEASTAREEALLKVQKKKDAEDAEAKTKADAEQALLDQQAELDRQKKEMDDRQAQLDLEEQQRIEAKAKEEADEQEAAEAKRIADAAPQVDSIAATPLVAQSGVKNAIAKAISEGREDARQDIEAVIMQSKKAEAAGNILDAIVAGKIRFVIAPGLAGEDSADA